MATAKAGIGAIVEYGDGASPEVFTAVPLAGDVTGLAHMAAVYDTTNHNNTNKHREKIAGLKDTGELSFPVWFDVNDTVHVNLFTILSARTKKNWRITIPDSSPVKYFRGPAFVTGLEPGFPVDGVQTLDVTLTPSDAWSII